MERIISRLQTVLKRIVVTTLIVVITLSLGNNSLQAQATPLTTEYNSAEVKDAVQINTADPQDVKEKVQQATEATESAGKDIKESTEETGNSLIEKIEDVTDNLREKLNLDEPLPPSTKKFLNSPKNPVKRTVEGTKEGLKDAAEQVTGKPAY